MPPAARNVPEQSGLFSSVFGFFSREVGNFVASATGGEAKQVFLSAALPSRTFSRADTGEKRHGLSQACQAAEKHERGELYSKHDRPRREREHSRSARRTAVSPSPQRELSPEIHSPSPRRASPPAPSRRSRSIPRNEPARPPTPEVHSESDHEPASSASVSPPPIPRQLRRRPSTTMPGSLFPRSESLEPDESQGSDGEAERHVHFAPAAAKNADRKGSVEHEEPVAGPSKPRDESARKQTVPRSPSRPRIGSAVDSVVRRFDEDADPSLLLPAVQHSPSRAGARVGVRSTSAKGKERADDSSASGSSAAKGKGKERVLDFETAEGDSSGIIRMKGKERELDAARQELREKERRWERDSHRSDVHEEERRRDQERIKLLEEENRRLREELALAKRPSTASTSQHSGSNAIPPPPPPPPPPLPTTHHRAPTTEDTSSLFASVRASLKRTAVPVEAPINAAVYGGASRVKRTGQPTVNVSSDKMAAFLSEMKTVRLRKTNSTLTGANTSGANLERNTSFNSSTASTAVDSETRGSRDRDTAAPAGSAVLAAQRRLTDSFTTLPRRVPMSQVSQLSRSVNGAPSSSLPVAGPSTLAATQPANRTWPSVSMDGAELATPSLTDDNDLDTSSGDRLSSPSPIFPAGAAHGLAIHGGKDEGAPTREERAHHGEDPTHRSTSPAPSKEPAERPRHAVPNLFDKRPPTSPMPNRTPRKARPPARVPFKAVARSVRIVDESEDDDDDDPLRLSYASASVDAPLMRPVEKDKGPPAASKKRPRPVGQKSTKASREPSTVSARSGSHAAGGKGHNRRRTLDEELRGAEDSLREDLQGLDVEDEVLLGTGTRSKRRGFLAHGGAGGSPVFMGVGYVEGAEEEEEREEPEERPQKKRRKGRSTAAILRGVR